LMTWVLLTYLGFILHSRITEIWICNLDPGLFGRFDFLSK